MKEKDFGNTVVEIRKNDTLVSFDYKDGKFTFYIDANTELYLDNISMRDSPLKLNEVDKIKKASEERIKNKLIDLVNKTKKNLKLMFLISVISYIKGIIGYGVKLGRF